MAWVVKKNNIHHFARILHIVYIETNSSSKMNYILLYKTMEEFQLDYSCNTQMGQFFMSKMCCCCCW